MPSSFFSPKTLEKWYIQNGWSTYTIASRTNCDPKTVYYWLKRLDIPPRKKKLILINKRELTKLYNSGMSLYSIGKKLKCSASGVLKICRKYNIKTRTTWETNTIHPRHDFSNNEIEKAYLIGFRIGDLGVSKRSAASSISVKSNTTKTDQVYLMKNLFSKYGPVWVSKSPTKTNVFYFSSLLNHSFTFLLKKHKYIPGWVMKSNRLFLAFLAGYSDAEGSMGVYSGRGKFRVGSYDKEILYQIYQRLNKMKIKTTFWLETRAGVYGGEKHNGDFYRVTISDRHSLQKCLNILIPYLKHKNRRDQALLALKNVTDRINPAQIC